MDLAPLSRSMEDSSRPRRGKMRKKQKFHIITLEKSHSISSTPTSQKHTIPTSVIVSSPLGCSNPRIHFVFLNHSYPIRTILRGMSVLNTGSGNTERTSRYLRDSILERVRRY